MLKEVLKLEFFQNALLSAFLASLVCGVIGTVIVEKKLVMMSGGISHASFGGVGLGYLLNMRRPVIGALVTAILAAFGLAYVKHNVNTDENTLSGIIWPLGMSVGILFISITPGYPPDLTSYLFGDILTVTNLDIWMMLFLNILVLIAFIPFFQLFKAYLFDNEFARLNGIKSSVMDYILFLLIGLSVVVLIRVVGIILVIALLTIPAAIVKMFTFKFHRIMILSAVTGMFMCVGGLFLSYLFLNIPSGAVIVILGGIMYAAAATVKRVLL